MENIQYNEIYEKDIKDFKWVPIKDCRELFLMCNDGVYPRDIENYVDLVIRKIAREFKVDYNYAKEVIREENRPFFYAKQWFFEKEDYYSMKIESEVQALNNLFNLFYIPTKNDDVLDNVEKVDKLVVLFNSLSPIERLQFLNRIEKVSIKVDMM